MRDASARRRLGVVAVRIAAALCLPTGVHAEGGSQFGAQERANRARDLVVLAIQQGISSLPPTSGQSFTYRFDLEEDYKISSILGPTSFRSTQPVGKNRLSVRLAFSYFDLSDSLGPVDYKILSARTPDPPGYCTRFGVAIDSNIGLFNIGTNYGITDRIEVDVNVPVVISDTSAFETFPSQDGGKSVSVVPCAELGQRGIRTAKVPFSSVQLPAGQSVDFNEGTNAGVGRISIGAKANLCQTQYIDVAFFPELFFPSPNQDQFAGSDSPAILPRLVFQGTLEPVRAHVDVGYDYDFDRATLRRFTWSTGLSVPITSPQSEFDLGMGGSVFNGGIQWTPTRAPILDQDGRPIGSIRALGDTRLGNNFVDFLAGMKFRVSERSVVSGAVNVPVNNDGLRAAVVGTVAFEYYVF